MINVWSIFLIYRRSNDSEMFSFNISKALFAAARVQTTVHSHQRQMKPENSQFQTQMSSAELEMYIMLSDLFIIGQDLVACM